MANTLDNIDTDTEYFHHHFNRYKTFLVLDSAIVDIINWFHLVNNEDLVFILTLILYPFPLPIFNTYIIFNYFQTLFGNIWRLN